MRKQSVRKQARRERLMPGGIPKWIRCYDDGPDGTIDRYTVVYTRINDGYCHYVGMSGAPYHPQGVCQHGEHSEIIDRPSYKHLGKRIQFADLPADCRQVVINDYKAMWGLED